MPLIKTSTTQTPKEAVEEFNAKERLAELEEQNKNLLGQVWIDSLSDDKRFRLELIKSITEVSEAIKALTEKVVELTAPQE